MFINGKVYNLHIPSLTDMFDPELYNVQEQRESSQQFNFFTLAICCSGILLQLFFNSNNLFSDLMASRFYGTKTP